MAAASSCSAGVPTATLSQRRKATKGETAKIAKIAKGQQQRKAQTGLNSHEAWQPPDAAGVPSEIEFCKKQSEVFSDLMEGGSPATLFFAKFYFRRPKGPGGCLGVPVASLAVSNLPFKFARCFDRSCERLALFFQKLNQKGTYHFGSFERRQMTGFLDRPKCGLRHRLDRLL